MIRLIFTTVILVLSAKGKVILDNTDKYTAFTMNKRELIKMISYILNPSILRLSLCLC